MSQKSILSFFSKKSTSNGTPPTEPLTPRGLQSDENSNKKTLLPTTPKTPSAKKDPTFCDDNSIFAEGAVVWAKLDSFPWWPSLVCKHPSLNAIQKPGHVHVQFFDKPITRSWIKLKNVKSYEEKEGIPVIKDSKWVKGCKEADNALKVSLNERLKLIVELLPSEDEEEPEKPDVTPKCKKPLTLSTPKSSKAPLAKRRRIVVLDHEEETDKDEEKLEALADSSEDEYKPGKDESVESEEEDEEEVSESEPESESKATPAKKRKKSSKTVTRNGKQSDSTLATPLSSHRPNFSSPASTPRTPAGEKTKQRLSYFASSDSPSIVSNDERTFFHTNLEFMKPEKIRDAERRRPDDPDYDPTTFYIPEDFKSKLTPAMRQWWDVKSKHRDAILFFKVGKFYELYHMDADVGVRELNLSIMKGEVAHCGFPEAAFGRFSAALVTKGYKVARVEQTETPESMNDRVKNTPKSSKFDKVVKREVCQITSIGTKTQSFFDGSSPMEATPNYLLAVVEKGGAEQGGKVEMGICLLEASLGTFYLGQFTDDRHRSRLATLLAHFAPVQILVERNNLSPGTRDVIKTNAPAAIVETLATKQFWDPTKVLRFLVEGNYFAEGEQNSKPVWPEGLKPYIDEASSLGLTGKEGSEMAIQSLGAVLSYALHCKIEQALLVKKDFRSYVPVDLETTSPTKAKAISLGEHMVLDSITVRNLDLFVNSSLGSTEGTLLQQLDHCQTHGGKRLLRQWLCRPLCDVALIEDRQRAINDLMNHQSVVSETAKLMKTLPDLERILSKIRAQGSAGISKEHPDSRAIFYEETLYSKRKIQDLLSALEGFQTITEINDVWQGELENLGSKLVRHCVILEAQGGNFPDLMEVLNFFQNAFNREEAKKEGKIIPRPGVDLVYSEAIEELQAVEKDIEAYLAEQKKYFGCKVAYVGTAKNRLQIEVPESAIHKAGDSYMLQGSRKGFKRFYTPEAKDLLARLLIAEEGRDSALRDISRRIFAQFESHRQLWNAALQCISTLDVLMSLAHYSRNAHGKMCQPKLKAPSADAKPFLKLVEGRHPIMGNIAAENFIPNDMSMGINGPPFEGVIKKDKAASLVLVTGPNMGGKSTLMRQVGLTVILAQMGCYVPASSCEMTPVDRLFTRLGASDSIMSGESTFFVELSETSAILQHATPHALVLLDELGRGTATYDGTAIAYAVLEDLRQKGCRTLFSTHYHSLVKDMQDREGIVLGHMACMVENEDLCDPTKETITFLYKFTQGACPKSYGFHAARLAGLPDDVIKIGFQKARALEQHNTKIRLLKLLMRGNMKLNLKDLKEELQKWEEEE